jgi:hypothetical protein
MTPRLEIELRGMPALTDLAGILGQVGSEHRFRLILQWPEASGQASLVAAMARAALEAGFLRVRLKGPASGLTAAGLGTAVAGGLNELEVMVPGHAPWEAIRELRRAGGLRYVSMVWMQDELDESSGRFNPCDADELKIRCESGRDNGVDRAIADSIGHFRRVAVRGLPLCWLPSLGEDRVIANAVAATVDAGGEGRGAALPPFEDPDRCWVPQCGRCSLYLACDGLPRGMFGQGLSGSRVVHPFGGGDGAVVPMGPGGLVHTGRSQSFLTGRTHVHAVAAGVRPCGRMAVPIGEVPRQAAFLKAQGLVAVVVDPEDAPGDRDGVAALKPAHVFFSLGNEAAEAADLERAFARAESGSNPMGADVFGRGIGRLLGYPDCCIDAFVAAGPDTSTDSLVREAHGRSTAFAWELNQIDPRTPFPLVAHVPCRFDCPASLALARQVLCILPKVFPYLDGAASRYLGRPVLYVDPDCAVSFAGWPDPDGEGVTYSHFEAFAPGSGGSGRAKGLAGRILALLALGNRVRVDGRTIRVFRGDEQELSLELAVEPKVFGFIQGQGQPNAAALRIRSTQRQE